ncbi:MAG: oligosaccharide flippase family protein [Chloroflexi bacterium]|nr:oligosaccharide flippase family protein [Chloroflexota bacterium]
MDFALASIRAMAYRLSGMFAWALIGVLTARLLSVEDRGLYASTVAAIALAGVVGSSFVGACGYYVARHGHDPAEVAGAGGFASLASGAIILLISAGAFAFYDGGDRWVILLVGFAVFPTIARNALGAVFLATHALWRYNFGTHGPAYLGLAAIVVWVVLLGHRSAEAALGAWLLAQYLSLALMVVMARAWWHGFAHRPSPALSRALVSFGAMLGFVGLVSLANQRADLLMVAWLDGKDGAGVYASALAVGDGLLLFAMGISTAAYRDVGSLSPAESARVTATSARHTIFLATLGAAATFVVAPFAIELVFGPRYGGAANALRVLSVAAAVFSPQAILTTYFIVQRGRPLVVVALGALSFAIEIVLCLLLVPRIGIAGGAWATLVSYAVTTVLFALAFRADSGLSLAETFVIRRAEVAAYPAAAHRALRSLRHAGAAHPAPAHQPVEP